LPPGCWTRGAARRGKKNGAKKAEEKGGGKRRRKKAEEKGGGKRRRKKALDGRNRVCVSYDLYRKIYLK
jgi:hypothetical protein